MGTDQYITRPCVNYQVLFAIVCVMLVSDVAFVSAPIGYFIDDVGYLCRVAFPNDDRLFLERTFPSKYPFLVFVNRFRTLSPTEAHSHRRDFLENYLRRPAGNAVLSFKM